VGAPQAGRGGMTCRPRRAPAAVSAALAATVVAAAGIGAPGAARAACAGVALASDTPAVLSDGQQLGITVTNLQADGAGPSHILALLRCQGRHARDLASFVSLAGTEPSAQEILKAGQRRQFSVPVPYQALPQTCRAELVACVYPYRL